jgi:hypothetical protein
MKRSRVFAAGLVAVAAGMALAAPPAIVSVRQAAPPEILQQMRAGLLPAAPAGEAPSFPVPRFEKLELRIEMHATYNNPYDPDQVDLWTEFTAPSGKLWKIWGFYNPTSYSVLWMVRFAPTETGTWKYVVKVKDHEGTAESKPAQFAVTESRRPGFVGIAANKRYLQYSNGTPFYGVGIWYNDNYERYGSGSITEDGLDTLKQHGANFISFYNTPLETMGTGLGRYDEDRAGRLDQIFDWCEKRDLMISWNIWFHSYFSEEVWGDGNARYAYNPYRTIASADQYFASDEAWKYTQKLYRYQIARWGYSRSLALWFVDDEINGTEGWTRGGSQGAEAWCLKVNNWLKANDPYGRPTTGTRSGAIGEWWPNGYKIYDIAAREIYEAQGHSFPKGGKPDVLNDNPLQHSYLNYVKQTQDLWNGFDKPAIVGETGWDHTYYEPGTPGYLAMYHNALWASLANGLCMTPFWWADGSMINDSVITRSMTYFARFVGNINFSGEQWKPVSVKVTTGNGWAMQSPTMTFGWFVNPMSGVAKESVTVPVPADGVYDISLYRTWRGEFMPAVSATSTGGTVTVTIPELTPVGQHAQNINDDVAFKIVKK